MSDQVVTPGTHFKLDLGGKESGLLFKSASMPTGTLALGDFQTSDGNGGPVQSCGGGTKVQWSDVTLMRGVDKDQELYNWFKDVKEKGVCSDTQLDIKIIALDSQNEPLKTWSLTGAVISSYGMSGVDAESGAILTEQVSIKFTDATLES
ncbi:phage tail protein [Baekduia soli]|uniref:Phage tail protein n=1 Tax=Baekduia soli TaxID=496014 RepID=A0A5B8U5Q9_9ACTN|nr:phage tail protein [Baekduia soli]QEC48459.1 phage tail protein [Baekduia soli]